MTKERANKAADYLSGLFWCFTRSRMTRDQVDHLAALLADEAEAPPDPPKAVYETPEELAAAIADGLWIREAPDWKTLHDVALPKIRRYQPEVHRWQQRVADEPEPEPEKPPEPVYRTAEYLAAALVVRACPPEQVSEGARLFDDFLAMLRRYKPEVK